MPFSTPGSVETTLKLPDIVSLGIRQQLSPQWALLGTVEWSNWSRIGTVNINQLSGGPALVANNAFRVPFEYDDGWFFSAGTEYRWNERLTLRGGIGYEISPISDQVRTPRLPDNDRFWASIGASWNLNKSLRFDFAYTHLWVKDTNINITAASGNPSFSTIPYVGTSDAHTDLLSGSLVVRFDDIEPTVKKPFMSGSICDALLSNTPGELTFPITRELIGQGTTVNDDEVGNAVRYAFHELKLVVEPGGVIGLAALLAGKVAVKGKVVVAILSGANVDPDLFGRLIAK